METVRELKIAPFQPPLNDPLPFFEELAPRLGFSAAPEDLRQNEKALSLAPLVLLVDLDSETPFHRFLEGQPCRVNIDKLERKRYLISGSVRAFRELYLELKEQKVSKALLIFLCQHFAELFEDLWPKHGIVPPAGINFRTITAGELEEFELPIKMRHQYLLGEFSLPWEDLPELYELEIRPVLWERAASCIRGFLPLPLIQYMALLSRFLNQEHPLREPARALLRELKERFPEPFGLLPD